MKRIIILMILISTMSLASNTYEKIQELHDIDTNISILAGERDLVTKGSSLEILSKWKGIYNNVINQILRSEVSAENIQESIDLGESLIRDFKTMDSDIKVLDNNG